MDKVDEGIVGIITNHRFLTNPSFKGMRQSLLRSFDHLYFIDLHGSNKPKETAPDGGKDENVFDIEQGVAISILVKKRGMEKKIFHTDWWGSRKEKYDNGWEEKFENVKWKEVNPDIPFYLFKPGLSVSKNVYQNFFSLKSIFKIFGNGLTTAHDEFVTAYSNEELLLRFLKFKETKKEKDYLHTQFKVKEKQGWDILKAWGKFQTYSEFDIQKLISNYNYRPFDIKKIIYEESVIWRVVKNVMLNFREDNVGLVVGRAGMNVIGNNWNLAFITNSITDFNIFSRGGGLTFPLYLIKNGEEKIFFGVNEPEALYKNCPSGVFIEVV